MLNLRSRVSQAPAGYTRLLAGLNFAFGPSGEVVKVGDAGAADTKAVVDALRKPSSPNKVVIFRSEDTPGIIPFARDMSSIEGKLTAFVCQDYHCESPTSDHLRMLELLDPHREV